MAEPDPNHTLEERVVHWYFSQLDKNSSGDIGKKEIKPFKRFLRKKSKPKKCVKKFVEYCDISNDKALSLQELMGCLGVTKEEGELHNTTWCLNVFSWPTSAFKLAYWLCHVIFNNSKQQLSNHSLAHDAVVENPITHTSIKCHFRWQKWRSPAGNNKPALVNTCLKSNTHGLKNTNIDF